jgi:hypothetical protein
MIRFEKLSKSVRRVLGLSAGAAVLTFASASSMAAIVCTSPALSVPANIDGVYMNLVTGAQGTSGGAVAGWDINLYQTGTPAALYFFWPTAPASSFGGVAIGNIYESLTSGAPIGAAQAYSLAAGQGGPPNYVNWHVVSSGRFLGVRFFNEATSAINYGWMQIITGSTNGFPATINQICYDNTGASITAGTTPVALQRFSVD